MIFIQTSGGYKDEDLAEMPNYIPEQYRNSTIGYEKVKGAVDDHIIEENLLLKKGQQKEEEEADLSGMNG